MSHAARSGRRPQRTHFWERLVPPVGAKQLVPFYRQLATMLEAGVPLLRSLDVAGRSFSGPSAAAIVADLRTGAASGIPLHERMACFPHVFRTLDVEMVRAGEDSGRLPAVLEDLAELWQERAGQRRLMVHELTWPIITLHALFLLAPLPDAFLGRIGIGGYLVRGLGPLVPLYALVLGTAVGLRLGRFSPALRRGGFRVVHAVPVLGGAVRKLAVARFVTALEALYEAGLGIEQALPIAGRASGNDVLAAACGRAADEIRRGETLHDALAGTREFPSRTLLMIATGEESGQLDVTLAKIAETNREEAQYTLRMLSRFFSTGVYLLVALAVAVRVITFYANYVAEIRRNMP